MKKFIALIFAVIAGICTVIAQNRTFTVGFDAGFPPYGYTENGEYKGFDLDLAREVARRSKPRKDWGNPHNDDIRIRLLIKL